MFLRDSRSKPGKRLSPLSTFLLSRFWVLGHRRSNSNPFETAEKRQNAAHFERFLALY